MTTLRTLALALFTTGCASGILEPTGSHPVGTVTWVVEHAEGLNDPLPPKDGLRRVPVQAWFPADQGQPGDVTQDASLGVDDAPVLLFVHGTASERSMHTSLFQELASQGFVAIAADHPGIARRARFPDQKAVKTHDAFKDSLRSGDMLVAAAQPIYPEIIDLMRADLDLVLDGLPSTLAGLDTTTIAVGGHSLGASVALDFCRDDPRCGVFVNLDGPPLIDQVGTDANGRAVLEAGGLDRPTVVVSTGQYAEHVDGAAEAWTALDDQAERIEGPVVHWHTEDAGHLDVTDISLIMPSGIARSLFGKGSIGRVDSAVTVAGANDAIRVFLERHLACDDTAQPEAMDTSWPLLELRHAHDDRRSGVVGCR